MRVDDRGYSIRRVVEPVDELEAERQSKRGQEKYCGESGERLAEKMHGFTSVAGGVRGGVNLGPSLQSTPDSLSGRYTMITKSLGKVGCMGLNRMTECASRPSTLKADALIVDRVKAVTDIRYTLY